MWNIWITLGKDYLFQEVEEGEGGGHAYAHSLKEYFDHEEGKNNSDLELFDI